MVQPSTKRLITEAVAQRQSFDVKTYGALGDGSTDDATKIQTVLGLAATAGGGVVYFPAGTYVVGTALTVSADITLQGAGWTSVLKAKNSLNGFIVTYDNTRVAGNRVFIRDLAFDGNNTNQSSGGCVLAYNAIQCLFDNVRFSSPYDVGLHLYGQQGAGPLGHHNHIINCLFEKGGTSAGSGQGLRVQATSENYISSTDFEANGGAGSEAYHVKDMAGTNMFSSCVFVGGKEGIRLQTISNTRVVDCIFDSLGGDNVHGVGSNLTIQGCLFSGIDPAATTNTYKHIVIDTGGYCSILGNTFDSGVQTPSVRTAISQFSSSTNNAVVGNVFRQNTTVYGSGGLYDFNGSSAAATSTIIRDNNGLADESTPLATVIYSGSVSAARPAADTVIWENFPTEPTNMVAGDVWMAPSATPKDSAAWVGPNGAFRVSTDRVSTVLSSASFTSGTLYVALIALYENDVITSIAAHTGGTSWTNVTHSWGLLADLNLQVLAVSSDVTTSTASANANQTWNLTSSYTVTTTGYYYVGFNQTNTTGPYTLLSNNGLSLGQINSTIPPIALGTSNTGLTTPLSVGATLTALTAVASPGLYTWLL